MSNLLLNIDFQQNKVANQSNNNSQPKQQKNKDKYKKNKQKIINKKIARSQNNEESKNDRGFNKFKQNPQGKQISDNSKGIQKDHPQQSKLEGLNKERKFVPRDKNKQFQKERPIPQEKKPENPEQVEKPSEEKEKTPAEQEEEVKQQSQQLEVFASEKFDDLPINNKLKEILQLNQFGLMTNIQKKSIPVILKEQNSVIKSETGSGKTLCYLVPLIEYLSHKSLTEEKINRENGTYCIIFSPTRELCVQIEVEFNKLLKLFHYVVCGTITGGENPKKEKSRIRKGITVIICTPGRFLYHLQNTQSMNFSHLSCLIFDEADRILDQGFEREMLQCLQILKKKVPEKFKSSPEVNNFWSDQIKICMVSATLSKKIEDLGNKLMQKYVTVGFDEHDEGDEIGIVQIPKQIVQFYSEVPTQYRLLYLITFLYQKQTEKVIVFVSNCELVNFLFQLINNLNWNHFGKRELDEQQDVSSDDKPQIMAGGHIYKLHGDMDHSERKKNYFGFDKAEHSILICTDVASRGLDFKHVNWIVQYDLSSSIKDYVNRIGRTARIASSGNSLCFIMPQEIGYVAYMKKNHGVDMIKRERFQIMKNFEKSVIDNNKNGDIRFNKLKNIEDVDEQQEAIHRLRSLLRYTMQKESLNLITMANFARNSSTRAYTGHSHTMRSIFEINNLNLTEFARSFGLYKNVQIPKVSYKSQKNEKKKSFQSKKKKEEEKQNNEEADHFKKRLQKAQYKDIEKKLNYKNADPDTLYKMRLQGQLNNLKKEIYTDEKKVERRRQNFEKAKYSVGKKMLSEFE